MKKKRINDAVLASIPVQNGQVLKGEHLAILREVLSAAINENKYDIDRIIAGQDAVHVYGDDVEALNVYASENSVADETLGYLYTENQILLYKYITDEWHHLGVLNLTELFDKIQELDARPLETLVESGYYDEINNELVLVLKNSSEIRIPVGGLFTDLGAHNIIFNGSGTNYLTAKSEVQSAVKELDARVKTNADNSALKQDKLIAGENISIIGNTISASGGGGGIPDAPSDDKLYGRKNNTWEEIEGDTGPAGAYSETHLEDLNPNDTFLLSRLDIYDAVKFELIVDEILNEGSSIQVISQTINKVNITQKTNNVNKWIGEIGTLPSPFSVDVDDDSIKTPGAMENYMNANYPASEYSIGEKARGTDGILPLAYYYAKVLSVAIKRNVYINIGSGKVETENGGIIRFTISNPSNAIYKLSIYGIILS